MSTMLRGRTGCGRLALSDAHTRYRVVRADLLHGKKIGWRDGLATPIHLLRFNVFDR